MKILKKHWYIFILLYLFFACNKSVPNEQKSIDKFIKTAATDSIFERQEWDSLVKLNYVQKKFKNDKKLYEYIKKELPDYVKIYNPFKLESINIYLDNTGSMYGYLNGTIFKDVLFKLISNLKVNYGLNKIKIFYINSKIYPENNFSSVTEFIEKLEPRYLQRFGNVHNTDFKEIMKLFFQNSNPNSVSILISDFAQSVTNGNSEKALKYVEYTTQETFMDALKVFNFSTYLMQFSADFTGNYWIAGTKKIYLKDVQRPFYILFIGRDALLNNLVNQDIKSLSENTLYFTARKHYNLLEKKKLLLYSYSSGNYQPDANNSIKCKDKRSLCKIAFLVDLNTQSLLYNEDFILKSKNYVINSIDKFSLEIKKFNRDSIKPIEHFNDTISYNYVYILKAKQITTDQTVTVALPWQMPSWVIKYSDNIGTKNYTKTFGFQSLIQGMYNAYKENFSNSNILEFSLNIKL